MPPTTATTATGSLLPPLSAREQVASRLTALTTAITAHPQMQPPNPHPTLYHVWDFAMRTNYILSELDNIEAGRPIQHPEQIVDYSASSVGTPDPGKASELMTDVAGRCMLLELMIGNPNRGMMAVMGLQDMDFGEELKRKAAEVVEAVKALQRS